MNYEIRNPKFIRNNEDGTARVGGGTVVRVGPKVGRNDSCPCGSGKKYKKCCIENDPVVTLASKK